MTGRHSDTAPSAGRRLTVATVLTANPRVRTAPAQRIRAAHNHRVTHYAAQARAAVWLASQIAATNRAGGAR